MWDRIVLYGGALVVVGGLCWFAWVHSPVPSMESGVDIVMNLAQEDRFDDARELVDDLLEAYPQDVRGLHLLAWLQDKRDNLSGAQDSYRQSLALCDTVDLRRHVMLCIADIDRRLGKLDRAERYLGLAVQEHGESRRSKHLRRMLNDDRRSRDPAVKQSKDMAEEERGNGSSSR